MKLEALWFLCISIIVIRIYNSLQCMQRIKGKMVFHYFNQTTCIYIVWFGSSLNQLAYLIVEEFE